MKRNVALSLALALLLAGAALASGPEPVPQGPAMSPEDEARDHLNAAIKHKEAADRHDAEARAEADAGKKAKLEAKAKKEHEASIKEYTKATGKDAKLFQAWGGLGYAYRKTGNFDAALSAYDRALSLSPSYAPAIEYRAEAYLGLNRLEEVKAAYMTLFNTDRTQADLLASAIDTWLAKKKADPSGLDAQKLDDFARWAAQRKQIASQTSSVLPPKGW